MMLQRSKEIQPKNLSQVLTVGGDNDGSVNAGKTKISHDVAPLSV